MDDALGSETESIPADGNVTGKAAVEVFGHRFREARIDAPTQRLPDLDVLARDAKWHDRPPMTAGRRSRPRARAPGARACACALSADPSSPQKTPQYNIIEGTSGGRAR